MRKRKQPNQECMTIWLARQAKPPMSWTEIVQATGRSRGVVRRMCAEAEQHMASVRPPDM